MDNINCIYYINLEHRTDRKEHILKEFERMNIPNDKIIRFNAIKHEKGYIGCGKSHIEILKDAYEKGYDHIIIFEDDFKFVATSEYFKNGLIHLFRSVPEYNICLLGFNMVKKVKYDEYLDEVYDAQTTSGYIISKKYIPILIKSFMESVSFLENGAPQWPYSIDIWWKKLQGSKKGWYSFNQRIGIQMESYSDIEKKVTNYNC